MSTRANSRKSLRRIRACASIKPRVGVITNTPEVSSDRTRKCICVGNFSTKIEAAQKSKHLRDCRALFVAQSSREFELRSLAQNHARSLTAGVRRGKEENAAADLVLHQLQLSD